MISRFLSIFAVIAMLIFCIVDRLSARDFNFSRAEADNSLSEGLIIDSLVIDNRNIYNISQPPYDKFLYKTANKLHYRTRKSIIDREILLSVGEPFSNDLADETARNLRRRLTLFDAWVETELLDGDHLLVKVVTVDQWSLTSGVSINRDGNETNSRLYLEERNLVGSNQLLSLNYFLESDERNFLTARFQDRRFFGRPMQVVWSYNGSRFGSHNLFSFGHPFYNLSQKLKYEIGMATNKGRRDIYDDSLKVAESTFDGDRLALAGAYRFGQYRKKIRLNLQYLYRYERTHSRTITVPTQAPIVFPSDSLYHMIGTGITASGVDFVKLRRIDGFGFTEDFTTGMTMSIGLSRAFRTSFDSHVYDMFSFRYAQLHKISSNLISLSVNNSYWYQGSQYLRHRLDLSTRFYNQSFDFLTVAARSRFLIDRFADGSELLIIGGSSGVRGFDKFSQTGNRLAVFNLEGRVYPQLEILSAAIGGVVFADFGRTWKAGEEAGLKDYLISGGIGLRIYLERFSRNKVLRFDFAYSERNKWEISIGTDQYFRATQESLILTNL